MSYYLFAQDAGSTGTKPRSAATRESVAAAAGSEKRGSKAVSCNPARPFRPPAIDCAASPNPMKAMVVIYPPGADGLLNPAQCIIRCISGPSRRAHRAFRRCRAPVLRRRRARVRASFSSRSRDADSARPASSRGTTITPSSSATTTSPGLTLGSRADDRHVHRAQRRLHRSLADIERDQTGKPICSSSITSRTPASMTRPRTPRAFRDVARSSPK